MSSSEYTNLPANATLHPQPFTAATPDAEIQRFKQLVELSPLGPRTYENTTDEAYYGVKYEWMEKAKARWLDGYDWHKAEARINSFPNYTVEIRDDDDDGESYNVHFVALFSDRKDAVPIILMHGWPGSFLEFLDVLDLLKHKYPTASTLPYHVVVPSLPGYGYSDGAPVTKNMRMEDQARLMDKLMVGLGFADGGYVAQGGDVGSFVGRIMAAEYPACKALHLNFCIMAPPASVPESAITPTEKKFLSRLTEFGATGNAYAREHGTRPATIGTVLSSSPIALLAWIAEKFLTWTHHPPPLDAVLDSVTLYWFTASLPRAIFPYRQMSAAPHADPRYHLAGPAKALLGYSYFPYELGPVPRAWVATTGDLRWHRAHEAGGHFAAMEVPAVFLGDVEDFVAEVWEGVGGVMGAKL